LEISRHVATDLRGYDNSTMIEHFYYESGAIAFSVLC
jgi:hypothetical protein